MSSETVEATNNEKATNNDENFDIINKGELHFEKFTRYMECEDAKPRNNSKAIKFYLIVIVMTRLEKSVA
jgi:hypothetical protein